MINLARHSHTQKTFMHYWGEITSLIPADIILAGCDDKNSDFLIIFLYLVTKKHQLQFDDYDWKLQRAKEKVKWHSSLMDSYWQVRC